MRAIGVSRLAVLLLAARAVVLRSRGDLRLGTALLFLLTLTGCDGLGVETPSAIAANPTAAGTLPRPPSCAERPPIYRGESDRVVSGETGDGLLHERYFAVLPESHGTDPARRYPVLFLLHGLESSADEWLVCIRLLELSAANNLIVVLVQGSPSGFWIDWHNGERLREQALLGLLAHIDATFPTLANRAHRAIAGLSMGGYGALVQAARHPELYAAAASFSGILRASDPNQPWASVAYAAFSTFAFGAFADPLTGAEWRRAHDPASLAPQLAGMSLFLSAGNGLPCDADEVSRLAEPDPSSLTEPLPRMDTEYLHGVLVGEGIEHTYRDYSCGAHTFRTFQRGLEDAWPQLMAAIGAA